MIWGGLSKYSQITPKWLSFRMTFRTSLFVITKSYDHLGGKPYGTLHIREQTEGAGRKGVGDGVSGGWA